jgi:cupin 2 domain-containing protein
MADSGNLFQAVPAAAGDELTETLVSAEGVTVERIVSTGQATPEGQWYDQDQHEFVILLVGSAGLRYETEGGERALGPGDWLWIPARCRHRITRTSTEPAAIWLAVFVPVTGASP